MQTTLTSKYLHYILHSHARYSKLWVISVISCLLIVTVGKAASFEDYLDDEGRRAYKQLSAIRQEKLRSRMRDNAATEIDARMFLYFESLYRIHHSDLWPCMRQPMIRKWQLMCENKISDNCKDAQIPCPLAKQMFMEAFKLCANQEIQNIKAEKH